MRPARNHILPILLLPLLLADCSTPLSEPSKTTDYDRSYDFASVRSIVIQPVQRTVQSKVIISDARISQINAALEQELVQRGFQVVQDRADADVFLVWKLVVDGNMDVDTLDANAGYRCWECDGSNKADTRDYADGTFIVDVIDPISMRSVWRSSYESRLHTDVDPAQAAQNRAAAAKTIFAQFPPPANAH